MYAYMYLCYVYTHTVVHNPDCFSAVLQKRKRKDKSSVLGIVPVYLLDYVSVKVSQGC